MVNFLKILSAKRTSSNEPKVSPAATAVVPISGSERFPSQLLKDVLGDEPASCHPPLGAEENLNIVLTLSQRLSVGARLADAKRQAVEIAARLASLVDEETAQALKVIVQDLESRVCRIAFAGQMNAGKSSLINVLVEQPELLPADINPWTTVITNLHFGVPGAPSSGASFTFFSLEEWRRLSVGGRTRELTGRIFPDFDWKSLSSQVESMRGRAEQKLGPRFEELLGTEHTYPAITRGLLNRYVGAGLPGAAAHSTAGEGEFSDITKLASVFFDLGAFNFPTILIDTPGVNDPFLVRDEITRQGLYAADICVIVLTARQPLSTADLSLLRMLRGLNKNRLIIFINKIDEIEGGDEVLREVSQRVSVILKQEFPSARIPIVFGSALWARKALFPNHTGQDESQDTLATPAEEAIVSGGAFDWPSHAEIADTVTAETVFLRSGLSSLAVAISELMSTGAVADSIEAASSLTEALCKNLISCLEAEIRILSKCFTDVGAAKAEATTLKALERALAVEFNAFSERLARIYTEKVSELHQTLVETVYNSVAETLATPSEKTTLAHVSQIDLTLRVNLENAFLTAFESAAQSVRSEQELLRAHLAGLLSGSGLIDKLTLAISDKAPLSSSPSLAALGEPVALGLAASFGALAARPLPAEEQNTYLSRVIVADFEPIVVTLSDEAARALNDLSANLIQQMKTLTLRPLETVNRRISNNIGGVETAAEATGPARQPLERQAQAARETISKLQLILAANISTFPAYKPTH
jgi:GTP-binding protein EngB required for normal cell division